MSYDDFERNNGKEDKDMTCSDCGTSFVFTANDQQFFQDNNFTPPKRCKPCRAKKKAAFAERDKKQIESHDTSGRERY